MEDNETQEALYDLDFEFLDKVKGFNREIPGHSFDDYEKKCTYYVNQFVCNTCDRLDDCLSYHMESMIPLDGPPFNSPFRRFFTPNEKCQKYVAVKQASKEMLYVFASDGHCYQCDRRCVHPTWQLAGRGCRDCIYAMQTDLSDPGCGIVLSYTLPSEDDWNNAQKLYESWIKAGVAAYRKSPNPKAKVDVNTGKVWSATSKKAKHNNYCVYKYIDADGVIQYVGITNNMGRRVREHQSDKLGGYEWDIYYIPGLSKTDAEILESHFIAKYKTYEHFNVAKASDGLSQLLKREPKWERWQ